MPLRCLKDMAETALDGGDTSGCLAHTDALPGLAPANGCANSKPARGAGAVWPCSRNTPVNRLGPNY